METNCNTILNSAAFMDDNNIATGGDDGYIRLFDVRSGSQTFAIKAHEGGLMTVSANPTKFEVLTGGMDSFTRLWDMRSCKVE